MTVGFARPVILHFRMNKLRGVFDHCSTGILGSCEGGVVDQNPFPSRYHTRFRYLNYTETWLFKNTACFASGMDDFLSVNVTVGAGNSPSCFEVIVFQCA